VKAKRSSGKIKSALVMTAATALTTGFVGIVGTGTASAVPVSLTLNYTCPFPLIGTQAMSIKFESDFPTSIKVGEQTPPIVVNTTTTVPPTATQGLSLVGAKTLDGNALASSTVEAPGITLPVQVPAPIPSTPVPASGTFDVLASGNAPALTFTTPGTAKVNIGNILLTLAPKTATGELTGLGEFEAPCTLVAGQNTQLATFEIVADTPSSPPPSSEPPTSEPPTSEPPTSEPPTSEPPTSEPPTSEPPTSEPPTSEPPTSEPPTSEPPSSPPPGTVKYGYTLDGTTNIKKLKANMPVSGGIDADLNLATGAFTADLALNPTSGSFKILGFLPSTADVAFAQQGKTTGTLANGVLTSNSKTIVKLTTVKIFGLGIAGGETCQTKEPADITLKSTDEFFNPLAGGTIAGTYTLPALKDCGPLGGLVSVFMDGPGNTLTAKLTPKA
jgi:hypothetical protein